MIRFSKGERSFNVSLVCRFCYQTPDWMHVCSLNLNCKRDNPVIYYKANCTVNDDVACLGNFLIKGKRVDIHFSLIKETDSFIKKLNVIGRAVINGRHHYY